MLVKIGRRDFLEGLYRGLVAMGVGGLVSFEDLARAAALPVAQKPKLVWLHGSSCSGCSVSFLNSTSIPVLDIVTKFVDLVYHPDISSATGHQVEQLLDRVADDKTPTVFLFEGGIPEGLPEACVMAERPIGAWVERLVPHARAAIAVGTCATRGGIAGMPGTLTGSTSLEGYIERRGIETPVVSIPGCPVKPEHIVYVLLHLIQKGELPPLDERHRPLAQFGHTVHERCIYYASFQEKRFARFIGDDGCLFKLGCQGPITRNDCLVRGHNDNINTCIRAGHPCVGCASDRFPKRFMMHAYDDPRVGKLKE